MANDKRIFQHKQRIAMGHTEGQARIGQCAINDIKTDYTGRLHCCRRVVIIRSSSTLFLGLSTLP